MRRTIAIVALTFVASALFAIPSASASAPTWPATFRGLTDPQLLPIQLDVVQLRDGTLGLRDLFLEIELSCPTGERIGLGTGVGYVPALRLNGNRLAIDEIFGNEAFHVRARVSPNRVRGTVSLALAGFTPDEELQRCDAPVERFSAERVPEAAAGTATASTLRSPNVRTMFLVRPSRTTSRTSLILRSGPSAVADGGASYRGKTEQHLPIRFHVHGTIDRGYLDRAEFSFTTRCDDGTSGGSGGLGIIWIGGGPPVRDGSFAIDDVAFDEALHWSGHLGAVRAHGRLRWSVPAFTRDEQLQVCGSGDLTWRAHAA
jgi:hypothetical protein